MRNYIEDIEEKLPHPTRFNAERAEAQIAVCKILHLDGPIS
jgi:hypothetical protein